MHTIFCCFCVRGYLLYYRFFFLLASKNKFSCVGRGANGTMPPRCYNNRRWCFICFGLAEECARWKIKGKGLCLTAHTVRMPTQQLYYKAYLFT